MSNARLGATPIPDDRDVRLSTFVNFCNKTIAQDPDAHGAMRSILAFIVEATHAIGAAVALPEGDGLVVSCSTSQSAFRPAERIPLTTVAGQAFLERKTMLANSFGEPKNDAARKFSRIGTTIAAPIMQGRRAYAVLLVKYPALHGTSAIESHTVGEFAGVCGCVLDGAIFSGREADRRPADSSGGLPNTRAFERDVAKQIDLYRKYGIPMAVAYFQVPTVNDEALARITTALRGSIRATDTAFQIGDRCFSVVLKNCSARRATVALGRIQKALPDATAAVASPRPAEGARGFMARANREAMAYFSDRPLESNRSIWERIGSLAPVGQS